MAAASTQPVIILSGATGAVGRAIAEELASRDYRIVAVARSQGALETLQREIPGIEPVTADVTRDLPELIRTGTVRAVIHAAGAAFGGSILDVSYENIADAVNLKVGGLLRLVRSVDARLVRGSRIIAIGGNLGLDPSAGAAAPSVSNAALMSVVRQLSQAYGPRGVTSHLVAPGPIDTPRLRARAADEAAYENIGVQQVLDRYSATSPLGRLTTLAEVAWSVRILLDREAQALAGSTLLLDSGTRTSML